MQTPTCPDGSVITGPLADKIARERAKVDAETSLQTARENARIRYDASARTDADWDTYTEVIIATGDAYRESLPTAMQTTNGHCYYCDSPMTTVVGNVPLDGYWCEVAVCEHHRAVLLESPTITTYDDATPANTTDKPAVGTHVQLADDPALGRIAGRAATVVPWSGIGRLSPDHVALLVDDEQWGIHIGWITETLTVTDDDKPVSNASDLDTVTIEVGPAIRYTSALFNAVNEVGLNGRVVGHIATRQGRWYALGMDALPIRPDHSGFTLPEEAAVAVTRHAQGPLTRLGDEPWEAYEEAGYTDLEEALDDLLGEPASCLCGNDLTPGETHCTECAHHINAAAHPITINAHNEAAFREALATMAEGQVGLYVHLGKERDV